MAIACSCGNQDTEYKSGTSKKTGKKWQGWKCEPCNIMYGMDGRPWLAMGAPLKNAPRGDFATRTAPVDYGSDANITRALEAINKKLDLILEAVGGKDEVPF